MKIYDCFMYYDEDLLLDLRLNILDNYIDFFVIVESEFYHNGKKRNLKFQIKNFEKFKNKIIYISQKKEPSGILKLNETRLYFGFVLILYLSRMSFDQSELFCPIHLRLYFFRKHFIFLHAALSGCTTQGFYQRVSVLLLQELVKTCCCD